MDRRRNYLIGKNGYSLDSLEITKELLFKHFIWRIDEVARFLSVSKGHIYNLVSRREIPHRKKGRLLYFIPAKIHSWILEG